MPVDFRKTREGAIGTGIVPDNSEIKFRLGFNSDGVPVLALYEAETDVFIVQMTIEDAEVIYFKDFFEQFGR